VTSCALVDIKQLLGKKIYVTLRMGAASFFERSIHIFQIIFVVFKKTGTLIIFRCISLDIHECLQFRHMRNI
jgi:hypothetical protein